MTDLTDLIAEHRITATNPFTSPWESDQAAVRMADALEAVMEVAAEWDRMWHACPEGCCGSPEAASIREAITTALTESAQIAAQEPAGATQAPPEGVGTSGTLSGRLRSAADYQDRPGAYDELRAMADEVHRLEVHARVVEQSLRTARQEGS